MSRYTGRLPRTYAEALAMLGGRESRKIAGNTTVNRDPSTGDPAYIWVVYYNTEIAGFRRDGWARFTTGGYCTVSTHERLNAMCPADVAFTRKNWAGAVVIDQHTYFDADGVVIDTDGTRTPWPDAASRAA